MDDLITQIREAARNNSDTPWFDVVTGEHITYVESVIGIEVPDLLKKCYTEVSNGGFGPGYGITGLPGGYESSWGDLIQAVAQLRKLEHCEERWLPLIDFGCAQMLCVDCDDDEMIVVSIEGDFHHEECDFTTLMERWSRAKLPDLHSGLFDRPS